MLDEIPWFFTFRNIYVVSLLQYARYLGTYKVSFPALKQDDIN